MKKPQNARSVIRGLAIGLAVLSSVPVVKATPFASCITNNAGTISFYLNEGGGSVTVTYDDGSTNASYNGVTAGTNVAAGVHSFSLTGHTTYSIAVAKTGTGSASLINQYVYSGNQRGVVANGFATSPYFGSIYQANGGNGIIRYNSDLSFTSPAGAAQTAGVSWAGGSYGPDKIAVQTNSLLSVSDYSSANSTVWMLAPDLSASTQVLAGIGIAANPNVHGSEESQPVITGSIATGDLVLQVVDGEYGTVLNSILTYNIGSGPLPWNNPPDIIGPEINPNLASYGGNTYNFYGSLIIGPFSQVYTCNERGNFSNPNLGVYPGMPTATTPLLYDSRYNNDTADYFQAIAKGGSLSLPDDCAVSPDGKYVATIHLDNHFTIASLDANGLPINSSIYTVAPTSFTGNGRGIAFDAADNIISSSSGEADIQQWSLGLTATCITSGNASGTTGFQLVLPATTLNVTVPTNVISQTNPYGFPTNASFVITRSGSLSSPLVVNYTVGGTATNGTYTITSTNTITIPAGQSSANVTVTAVTDGIARATTSVSISLATSANYGLGLTPSGTILINNTAPDALSVAAKAATVYKAYSNDYASFVITRLGDTNAAAFTVSGFTFAGTAVEGVDYTAPATVTFNPGDITKTVTISPLVNGQPPVDTNTSVYTGNKTAIIGIATGSGYAVSGNPATLTILDNATPPGTVLFSDPLDSTTATNDMATWLITYANANMANVTTNGQYEVDFGWDLTTDPDGYHGTVSSPPSGATTALRVTVNKAGTTGTTGATAGVNVYPVNPATMLPYKFSGNYEMRFNMALVLSSDASYGTEGVEYGINHSGYDTNWWVGDGIVSRPDNDANYNWASDGVWYWIDADAGGTTTGDYLGFTGLPPASDTGFQFIYSGLFYTAFPNSFKDPGPFDVKAGLPSVESSLTSGLPAAPWVDVDVKQISNVVTMSINGTVINTYTNATVYTNGDVMLGYDDPFASIGQEDSAAFFSNLKVIQILPTGSIMVSTIAISGGNVVIDFTSPNSSDTITSFSVLGSGLTGSAAAVDTSVTGVTYTQLGPGAFQATFPQPAASAAFYRIKHN